MNSLVQIGGLASVLFGLATGSALADEAPAWLQDVQPGPYPIRVMQVEADGSIWGVAHIDGYVLPKLWRLHGVELPRPGRQAECSDERSRAAAAVRSIQCLTVGKPTAIKEVSSAPETERLAGRIILSDGRDLADALLRFGLARPQGTTVRDPWCGW